MANEVPGSSTELPRGPLLEESHGHKGLPSCLFLPISDTFCRTGEMFFTGRQEMRLLTPLNKIIAAHAFLRANPALRWPLEEEGGPQRGNQGLEGILMSPGALLQTLNLSGASLCRITATVSCPGLRGPLTSPEQMTNGTVWGMENSTQKKIHFFLALRKAILIQSL